MAESQSWYSTSICALEWLIIHKPRLAVLSPIRSTHFNSKERNAHFCCYRSFLPHHHTIQYTVAYIVLWKHIRERKPIPTSGGCSLTLGLCLLYAYQPAKNHYKAYLKCLTNMGIELNNWLWILESYKWSINEPPPFLSLTVFIFFAHP